MRFLLKCFRLSGRLDGQESNDSSGDSLRNCCVDYGRSAASWQDLRYENWDKVSDVCGIVLDPYSSPCRIEQDGPRGGSVCLVEKAGVEKKSGNCCVPRCHVRQGVR